MESLDFGEVFGASKHTLYILARSILNESMNLHACFLWTRRGDAHLSLAMNVCGNDDDECKQESIEFLGFLLQPMCTFPPRVDRQLLPTHRLLLISHHVSPC